MSTGNKPLLNTNPFQIGEIWNVKYSFFQPIIPPHVEDVIVEEYEFSNNRIVISELNNFLLEELGVPLWHGSIKNVFNSKLNWTKGGIGYIVNGNLPTQSVGFWIPNVPLSYTMQKSVWYYMQEKGGMKYIKYAGYQKPIKKISQNTVLRISLTRWLNSDSKNIAPRCYIQLSGWY